MTRQFLFAVAAGSSLAACTGSTDPTTATLFDNMNNLSSGEYERQIAAKEAQAAAIVRANASAESQIVSLEGQRRANTQTITALNAEVAAVRREAASARAALEADPAANASELAQLSSYEAQLNQVQSSVNAGASSDVVRRELNQIRGAIRALSS